MLHKIACYGLLLALFNLFVTSFSAYGATNLGADIQALTTLADEYAHDRKPAELKQATKELTDLREQWEVDGRPQAYDAEIKDQIAHWRLIIQREKTPDPLSGDELTALADDASPYENEFNGSTLKKKEIVVTFDDGPHPKLTPLVHAYVKKLGIPAAFFEIGQNVKNNSSITRELASEGYVIGDHTWDHPQLPTLDDKAVAKEINDTQTEIQRVLGGSEGLQSLFSGFL
jgi:peptidoglycan/xylan/chitin deacetylase (PgdA/CDA1 family)